MYNMKLDFLLDVLKQKEDILMKVYNITENQYLILSSGDNSPEGNAFFKEMNKEKQVLIDEILSLDTVFQSSFKEIDGVFEEVARLHREKVVLMQTKIEDVLELDIKIRGAEQKNKEILDKKRASRQIPLGKAGKKYLLDQYKKNAKKAQ